MSVDLSAAAAVRNLRQRFGITPEASLGQNFLVDRAALRRIVDEADPGPQDSVLEVGSGLGVLTRALAERAAHVLTLELDARLLPVLDETLSEVRERVTVRHADAARFDHAEMPPGSLLVANLPYAIGTHVIRAALESRRYRRLVVLVQKEVADRLGATVGDPAYGALSLFVRHWGTAVRLRDVAPGAFQPAPAVTSSIVRVEPDPEARPDPETFALIREGFRHRRKTLHRNLRMAGYPAERTRATLEALGLDPRVRAEALTLAQFRSLRAALGSAPAERDGAAPR